MPLIVRNPNAFVISRIRKANYSRSELLAPRDIGEVAGPEESRSRVVHPNRSNSRSRTRSQASSRKQKSDIVDVSESSPPLSEKAPTTPAADYMDGSDGDKGTMLTIAPKKLHNNSVKRTLSSKCKKTQSPDADKSTLHAIAPKKKTQAVPREGPGQPSASRRQSPPPATSYCPEAPIYYPRWSVSRCIRHSVANVGPNISRTRGRHLCWGY